ncbi:MAG: type II toxin-antitoxin system VapC family toxin [Acidobacteriota bacterium]
MKTLLDTNILIDFLNGVDAARRFLDDEQEKAISVVTWIEVMVGARGPREEETIEAWLARFPVFEIDSAVAREAVALRRKYKIRLPDALIWATAAVHRRILATRNTRDFPADEAGIHVPYRIPSS